jgi:hypothetical protein
MANLRTISVSTRDENGDAIKGLDINMITLLIGHNGSGKTFFLVTAYVISEIAIISKLGLPEEFLKESARFIIQNSYNFFEEGQIVGHFDESKITVNVKNKEVTSIEYENWEAAKEIPHVKYMSTSMRTFSTIKHYLSLRKMISETVQSHEIHEKICQHYKLYDVKHVENMLTKVPFYFPPELSSALKNFEIEDDVEVFDVDLENSDFFYRIRNSEKKVYMTTLGNGHQSIFNMLINTFL